MKLVGMFCKKIGLSHMETVVRQLLYDHQPLKDDK